MIPWLGDLLHSLAGGFIAYSLVKFYRASGGGGGVDEGLDEGLLNNGGAQPRFGPRIGPAEPTIPGGARGYYPPAKPIYPPQYPGKVGWSRSVLF